MTENRAERNQAEDSKGVSDRRRLAEKVRNACVGAALDAYEQAKFSGLCDEGAWEAAIGAMRMVDVDAIAVAAGFKPSDGNNK